MNPTATIEDDNGIEYTVEVDPTTQEADIVDTSDEFVAEIAALAQEHVAKSGIELANVERLSNEGMTDKVIVELDFSDADEHAEMNHFAGAALKKFAREGYVAGSVSQSSAWFYKADDLL